MASFAGFMKSTPTRPVMSAMENRDHIHPETFVPQVNWRRPRYK